MQPSTHRLLSVGETVQAGDQCRDRGTNPNEEKAWYDVSSSIGAQVHARDKDLFRRSTIPLPTDDAYSKAAADLHAPQEGDTRAFNYRHQIFRDGRWVDDMTKPPLPRDIAAQRDGRPVGPESMVATWPACPCCKSNDRVTKSPRLEFGEFFCPCNEPGPQYFNRDGSVTIVTPSGIMATPAPGPCTNPLALAIDVLEMKSDVLRNNIPIQEREGRNDDAKNGVALLASIEAALERLREPTGKPSVFEWTSKDVARWAEEDRATQLREMATAIYAARSMDWLNGGGTLEEAAGKAIKEARALQAELAKPVVEPVTYLEIAVGEAVCKGDQVRLHGGWSEVSTWGFTVPQPAEGAYRRPVTKEGK